jgi:hypothetical protein
MPEWPPGPCLVSVCSSVVGRRVTSSLPLERRAGLVVGCGCVRGRARCRTGSGLVRGRIRSVRWWWFVDALVRSTFVVVVASAKCTFTVIVCCDFLYFSGLLHLFQSTTTCRSQLQSLK